MMTLLAGKQMLDIAWRYPMANHPSKSCNCLVVYVGPEIVKGIAPARIRFICTRERNHNGPHVAHVESGLAVAAWEED